MTSGGGASGGGAVTRVVGSGAGASYCVGECADLPPVEASGAGASVAGAHPERPTKMRKQPMSGDVRLRASRTAQSSRCSECDMVYLGTRFALAGRTPSLRPPGPRCPCPGTLAGR